LINVISNNLHSVGTLLRLNTLCKHLISQSHDTAQVIDAWCDACIWNLKQHCCQWHNDIMPNDLKQSMQIDSANILTMLIA